MDSKDRENWIKAMDNKIESLNENKTWVVHKQKDKEIFEVKWVYTRKSNDIFKARLVGRGFPLAKIILLSVWFHNRTNGCCYSFYSWYCTLRGTCQSS